MRRLMRIVSGVPAEQMRNRTPIGPRFNGRLRTTTIDLSWINWPGTQSRSRRSVRLPAPWRGRSAVARLPSSDPRLARAPRPPRACPHLRRRSQREHARRYSRCWHGTRPRHLLPVRSQRGPPARSRPPSGLRRTRNRQPQLLAIPTCSCERPAAYEPTCAAPRRPSPPTPAWRPRWLRAPFGVRWFGLRRRAAANSDSPA